jgi:NTP pyrophosphatase (non-canonical NTP hydrolase)
MNRIEHLLTIATEECAEVQQAATKALRFGLEEGKDCSAFEHGSNVERLRYELNDLIAVVEMLESEGLNLSPDYESRKAKKEKVERYLLYSKECGTLSS